MAARTRDYRVSLNMQPYPVVPWNVVARPLTPASPSEPKSAITRKPLASRYNSSSLPSPISTSSTLSPTSPRTPITPSSLKPLYVAPTSPLHVNNLYAKHQHIVQQYYEPPCAPSIRVIPQEQQHCANTTRGSTSRPVKRQQGQQYPDQPSYWYPQTHHLPADRPVQALKQVQLVNAHYFPPSPPSSPGGVIIANNDAASTAGTDIEDCSDDGGHDHIPSRVTSIAISSVCSAVDDDDDTETITPARRPVVDLNYENKSLSLFALSELGTSIPGYAALPHEQQQHAIDISPMPELAHAQYPRPMHQAPAKPQAATQSSRPTGLRKPGKGLNWERVIKLGDEQGSGSAIASSHSVQSHRQNSSARVTQSKHTNTAARQQHHHSQPSTSTEQKSFFDDDDDEDEGYNIFARLFKSRKRSHGKRNKSQSRRSHKKTDNSSSKGKHKVKKRSIVVMHPWVENEAGGSSAAMVASAGRLAAHESAKKDTSRGRRSLSLLQRLRRIFRLHC